MVLPAIAQGVVRKIPLGDGMVELIGGKGCSIGSLFQPCGKGDTMGLAVCVGFGDIRKLVRAPDRHSLRDSPGPIEAFELSL